MFLLQHLKIFPSLTICTQLRTLRTGSYAPAFFLKKNINFLSNSFFLQILYKNYTIGQYVLLEITKTRTHENLDNEIFDSFFLSSTSLIHFVCSFGTMASYKYMKLTDL